MQHTFGKDQHGIRMKDIDHKDRQNYDAVLHITSDSVLTLLSHIPDARGKVAFLNVIRCVIDSFLDKKLDALSRIDKAWYAVFFSRYWRRNFITANAYKCIELNAHSLITFLMTVRDSFHPDCQSFIPWMLGSQSCEKYEHHVFYHHKLEHAWSFTKTQFCLEAQSEETGIKYPHKEAHEKKDGHHKATICHVFSVTNEEIVKTAREKAKETIISLGMSELLQKHKCWKNPPISDLEGNSNDESEEEDIDDQDDGGQWYYMH